MSQTWVKLTDRALTSTKLLLVALTLALIWLLPNADILGISRDSLIVYILILLVTVVMGQYSLARLTATGYESIVEVAYSTLYDRQPHTDTYGKPNSLESVMVNSVLVMAISLPLAIAVFWYQGRLGAPLGFSQGWPIFASQLLVVVPVETIVFQMMWPQLMDDWLKPTMEDRSWRLIAVVALSQLLFAFMHWTVYGGIGLSMVMVFLQGCLWTVASSRYGWIASFWPHLIWNCFALSVFGFAWMV